MEEPVLNPNACSIEAPRPCEVATGMGFMARLLAMEGLDPSPLLVQEVSESTACRLMERAVEDLRGRPEALEMAREIYALTFPAGCPSPPRE